jgi:hypothetical protein
MFFWEEELHVGGVCTTAISAEGFSLREDCSVEKRKGIKEANQPDRLAEAVSASHVKSQDKTSAPKARKSETLESGHGER